MLGVWGIATAHAGCDGAAVQRVLDALVQASPEVRTELAAAGLAEACDAPAGLTKGAADLASVPPEMRPMIDLKVASDEPKAWMAVCSGGLKPLAEMVALAPDAKRDHLWARCELERLGWFTREQWNQADGPVVIPLIGGRALADAGVSDEQVGRLVRALAGVEPSRLAQRLLGASTETIDPVTTGFAGSAAPEDKADFAPGGRVEPTWSKAAKRRGGSCVVQIQVSAQGTLRDLEFVECDDVLQGDVRAAIEASTLSARSKDGAPAAGRFRATYQVE